eukprot:scaffold1982_cov358-Pavlova_lutheri.AAC.3
MPAVVHHPCPWSRAPLACISSMCADAIHVRQRPLFQEVRKFGRINESERLVAQVQEQSESIVYLGIACMLV